MSFLVLATALVALPGCGGSGAQKTNSISSATPLEALEAAKQAAADARSVTIHGNSRAGGGSLKLNLQLSRGGGKGKITLLGTTFEVIRVGQNLYVKGSPLLYAQLGIKKPIPSNTWVKLPATNAAGALTDLAGETTRILSTNGALTQGTAATAEGYPALELKTEGKLYKGRLYIKTTGQPYPIKLEKSGRETAEITFSGWNEPVKVTPPAKVMAATPD